MSNVRRCLFKPIANSHITLQVPSVLCLTIFKLIVLVSSPQLYGSVSDSLLKILILRLSRKLFHFQSLKTQKVTDKPTVGYTTCLH